MDFVVGHPRSGTRFISELLNASGVRVSGHELLIDFERGKPIDLERRARGLGGAALISLASRYYQGECPSEKIAALFEHYPEGPVRIDCNWKLTWILPPLIRRFPNARFVHLTRSPAANVRSTCNLGYYGGVTGPGEARAPHGEWTARWYDAMPELRVRGWAGLTPFEKNCEFWNETHRLIRETLADRPGYYRVRHEDLSDDRVVADLRAFLRVPAASNAQLATVRGTRFNAMEIERGVIDKFQSDFLPAYENWTKPQKDGLRSRCGGMAAALGYAL